jgi:phage shock protein C
MELKMQIAADTRATALPLRDHTILGVCEAIGEDFGFNPVFLRVPLAACVLFSVKYSIAAYLALGLIVLASRLIFPQRIESEEAASIDAQPAVDTNDVEQQQRLPIAA